MTIVFMGFINQHSHPWDAPTKSCPKARPKGCPVCPVRPVHLGGVTLSAGHATRLSWCRLRMSASSCNGLTGSSWAAMKCMGNGLPNGLPNANDMLIYWRLRPVWDFSWENQLRTLFQESGGENSGGLAQRKNIHRSGHPAKPLFSCMSVHQGFTNLCWSKVPIDCSRCLQFLGWIIQPPKTFRKLSVWLQSIQNTSTPLLLHLARAADLYALVFSKSLTLPSGKLTYPMGNHHV